MEGGFGARETLTSGRLRSAIRDHRSSNPLKTFLLPFEVSFQLGESEFTDGQSLKPII
jgi:hypothetical protein